MGQHERQVTELRLVVTATNNEAAVHYFSDVLGLPEQEAYQANGGHVVILEAGRATLEINVPSDAEDIDHVEVGHRVEARIRMAFEVPDVRATTSELMGAGLD
jgi:lactoylglutathione lyase